MTKTWHDLLQEVHEHTFRTGSKASSRGAEIASRALDLIGIEVIQTLSLGDDHTDARDRGRTDCSETSHQSAIEASRRSSTSESKQ